MCYLGIPVIRVVTTEQYKIKYVLPGDPGDPGWPGDPGAPGAPVKINYTNMSQIADIVVK